MNPVAFRFSRSARLAALLGTTSLLTMGGVPSAYAQAQVAQAEEIPETVLITGSLIRGTAAVGVPVTNLSPQDFAMTGALTTADLFRTFPAANVSPGPVATNGGGNIERATRVNLRGLDTGNAIRSLLMIDGMRFPPQGNGVCEIDPSIIPSIAQDHIDILVDGASATYGSDAIGGVINIILKRNFDGATTQLRYSATQGKSRYLAAAIWGRTWDGGQVTISYEWYDESSLAGNVHSNFTVNFAPWGLDDRRALGSALPGILSTGTPLRQPGGNVGTSAQLGVGCTNCYAIPRGTGSNFPVGTMGPTLPFSGSTLVWGAFNTAANSGTNGTRNVFDPYLIASYDASQQRNAAVITIDQRLTKDITFYGEGFYSNRRAQLINAANISPSGTNILQAVGVPTFNPYYPTGGAPTNLRINYNLGLESPPVTNAYELADRYQLGLRIALPYGWSGDVWYSETYDSSFNHVTGVVNRNAASAALGWTIGTTPASGTTPAIATWTKPASVPYLNVFCDPLVYRCNSDATLAYISSTFRSYNEKFWINEKGAKADGPLFDIPGGTVKAAIGTTFTSYHFNIVNLITTNAPTLIVPYQVDPESRQVWAVFGQVNIPVFSETFNFPLMRRLELEASWRHDQYSDVKGTSNPKVAFNWSPFNEDVGLTIRGAWGTSFRAPTFGEVSPFANVLIQGFNVGALGVATAPISAGCNTLTLPPVGSGAWKVASSLGNGMPGSATACPAAGITSILMPAGVSLNGGSGGAASIRAGGFHGWTGLTPELATNWGIGAEFAPNFSVLRGLDIQATYYIIKLNSQLVSFGTPTSSSFNDPAIGSFAFLVPTDWLGSGLPGASACTSNLLPTTCQPFEDAANGLLTNQRAQVSPQALTSLLWINDGGTFNKGWSKVDGIDWAASYDWEIGDLGAFNVGIVGTYYLHYKNEAVPGAPGSVITDAFHTTLNSGEVNEVHGVETGPRMVYRARLGWSNGPWSVTGFMDYQAHYFHSQTAPPDVNGNFCASNGYLDAQGTGGTFPCNIQGYTNLQPSYYTFDLSVGYNTMDTPANPYLRNIGIQVVIQNIMDKHSPFEYRISTGGGNPTAYDLLKSNIGRTTSIILTKQW